MLTRSKIKMEESFKEIHENVPSFNQQDPPYYSYQSIKQVHSGSISPNQSQPHQQHKYTAYRTEFSEESRPHVTRNEILK